MAKGDLTAGPKKAASRSKAKAVSQGGKIPALVERRDTQGFVGPSAKIVAKLAKEGRKVQVLGRVKNGKVELDFDKLNEMARKFPNANMAFVAVNAPFDPALAPAS